MKEIDIEVSVEYYDSKDEMGKFTVDFINVNSLINFINIVYHQTNNEVFSKLFPGNSDLLTLLNDTELTEEYFLQQKRFFTSMISFYSFNKPKYFRASNTGYKLNATMLCKLLMNKEKEIDRFTFNKGESSVFEWFSVNLSSISITDVLKK